MKGDVDRNAKYKIGSRQDGEYDILIEYSKADVEFAWEFGKRKNKQFRRYFKIHIRICQKSQN